MRKIIVFTFLTIDGVMQAPGGPDEDRTNDFKWGGWLFNYSDDETNNALQRLMSKPIDLLLGRRTYEIFAAHWPYQDDEIGALFNRINKYVVATTPIDTSWSNTYVINADVVGKLKQLKEQEGSDLLVHGSSELVHTLLANELVDELHTLIYPITLGEGKKLFSYGIRPVQWKVVESIVSPGGVIIVKYVPNGQVEKGSIVSGDPSDKEFARRRKWESENKQ